MQAYRWALRDSNPRPSPCKGDALPAELSARTRGVSARSAHHLSEGDGQPGASAILASVQISGPIGTIVLAVRTDQDLSPADHRPRPGHLALVGIERGAMTEETARPVRRPHVPEGYPSGTVRLRA